MDRRRVIASAVVLATAGAAVALTYPAIASDTAHRPATPESEMITALKRDLGLTTNQAENRIRTERWAATTTARLRRSLATDEWGGAWLNKTGDKLTIAVTDASAAATVRAAGAEARIVDRSATELNSVKSGLDGRERTAGDAISGWYVDVSTNSVVVLARPGAERAAQRWAARTAPSRSVRVETSSEQPRPLFDVRGADPYFINNAARCSVGFSVVGGFVTAGHCGPVGARTSGFNQAAQGTFRASSFPGDDFGFVEVNGDWDPRPVVNTSTQGELPVAGSTEAPVGASICRSGSTTGTRCGVITAKNATVRYPEGTVTGLTRTNVCAEPGDSGGSWLSGDQAQGITSGGSGNCTTGGVTFYQELNEVLQRLNLTLVTTQGEQPAPEPVPTTTAPPAPTPPTEEPSEPAPTDPPAEEEPAPPAACPNAQHAFNGSLSAAGARQTQPNGRFFRASSGRHTACLDGPDSANFDLFLQRWNGRRWATVSRATSAGADEQLTFTGRAGFYRYRVVSASGSGAYTLAF